MTGALGPGGIAGGDAGRQLANSGSDFAASQFAMPSFHT